jgi:hypothetical protein
LRRRNFNNFTEEGGGVEIILLQTKSYSAATDKQPLNLIPHLSSPAMGEELKMTI